MKILFYFIAMLVCIAIIMIYFNSEKWILVSTSTLMTINVVMFMQADRLHSVWGGKFKLIIILPALLGGMILACGMLNEQVVQERTDYFIDFAVIFSMGVFEYIYMVINRSRYIEQGTKYSFH